MTPRVSWEMSVSLLQPCSEQGHLLQSRSKHSVTELQEHSKFTVTHNALDMAGNCGTQMCSGTGSRSLGTGSGSESLELTGDLLTLAREQGKCLSWELRMASEAEGNGGDWKS